MTTRRGFLGSLLAAAAAPAFVKSESLMRMILPSSTIIIPSLDIIIPASKLAAGVYTASVWAKPQDGQWSLLSKTFTVTEEVTRKVKLELPGDSPFVYNLQLEAHDPWQRMPEVSMYVNRGSMRFDPNETPL